MSKHSLPTIAQIEIIKPIVGCSLFALHYRPSDCASVNFVDTRNLPSEPDLFESDIDYSTNPVSSIYSFSNFSEIVKPTSFKKFSPATPNSVSDSSMSQAAHLNKSPYSKQTTNQTLDLDSSNPKTYTGSFSFKTEDTSCVISPKNFVPGILKKGTKSRFCK